MSREAGLPITLASDYHSPGGSRLGARRGGDGSEGGGVHPPGRLPRPAPDPGAPARDRLERAGILNQAGAQPQRPRRSRVSAMVAGLLPRRPASAPPAPRGPGWWQGSCLRRGRGCPRGPPSPRLRRGGPGCWPAAGRGRCRPGSRWCPPAGGGGAPPGPADRPPPSLRCRGRDWRTEAAGASRRPPGGRRCGPCRHRRSPVRADAAGPHGRSQGGDGGQGVHGGVAPEVDRAEHQGAHLRGRLAEQTGRSLLNVGDGAAAGRHTDDDFGRGPADGIDDGLVGLPPPVGHPLRIAGMHVHHGGAQGDAGLDVARRSPSASSARRDSCPSWAPCR